MIRPATVGDIADLVTLTMELHRAARMMGDCEPDVIAGTMAALIHGGLVLVVETDGLVGFLAAETAQLTISRQTVAFEHGWYCRAPGWGSRLLAAYEAWARGLGCSHMRLSAPAGDAWVAAILTRAGFVEAETAWVKGL